MTFERFLDIASLSLLWLLVAIIAVMLIGGMVAAAFGAGDDFPE